MSEDPPLDAIERSIIQCISKSSLPLEQIANNAGLNIDQVRRGIERLKYKNLVNLTESVSTSVVLGENGRLGIREGLPERRLLNAVKAGVENLGDALSQGIIQKAEVSAAISNAKDNGWIELGDKGRISVKSGQKEEQSKQEEILLKIGNGIAMEGLMPDELNALQKLRKRPGFVEVSESKNVVASLSESARAILEKISFEQPSSRTTADLIISGRWKDVRIAPIDTNAPAPTIFPGRTHPITDIIAEIKEIFIGLGFSEISGEVIQSAFWNFDALYTPQDHPAREMQDTFYLSLPREPIDATNNQVEKISRAHRSGWGGVWDISEAQRRVLRTHSTPVTLQHLASLKDDHARLFSVGRVFRNEKVSYKHLVEFNQVEGVATYPEASLRDLIGLQTEFYKKMGITKIKFWPTFFPYTEPSLQSMVYNERLERWVELFGMGIFRPEVTTPLGIRNRVLAWGGGLERIAMLRFSMDDVRELYKSNLAWLRGVPKYQL